jgi:response regulator RpfG family c-di-GMP phosphodiesterase
METDSKARVLFVDDDADFLAAMARSLRSSQFEVTTVSSGSSALDILQRRGPFAVLVSDLRMPGMGGVELLAHARRIAPDTSRVLFTGQLDIEHALSAVNEGAIFRFIVKPCATFVVAATIKAAMEQYRLVTAERVLLEQTLRGSIQALTDVLGLASPVAFGRAAQLRQTICALASSMGIDESWHVEIAAMLSQIGYITLPPTTLEKVYKGEVLSRPEQAMLSRVPAIAEQVLSHIPRLEPVLEILRYSQYRFDGAGPSPGGPAGEQLPWGARVLKVILDLDALEREYASQSLAFDTLLGRKGWYDPAILQAMVEIRKHDPQSEVREVPLTDLVPGMILAKDVRCHNGVLYLARGQEITASGLEKLKNWSSQLYETDAIRVLINCSTVLGERHT